MILRSFGLRSLALALVVLGAPSAVYAMPPCAGTPKTTCVPGPNIKTIICTDTYSNGIVVTTYVNGEVGSVQQNCTPPGNKQVQPPGGSN